MGALGKMTSAVACRTLGCVYERMRGDFPALVRIETTNACNAKCVICPHASMKRPVERMSDALFGRIIEECAAARCREVHLHNFGEPLLDKGLEDRVRQAKQLGIRKVKIFSNGSLLTEDRAQKLIDAGLDEIKVSFDGASREEFEQIRRPLRFDKVVDNLHALVQIRNARRSPLKVAVACCSTTDRQATMKSLEQVVDDFSFGKIHNWGGEGETPKGRSVRKPCSRVWRTFTILASGDVSLCCLDYDGQEILGRIDENTSIRDVFHGARYREVRRLHSRGLQDRLPLCSNCTKAFF